MTSSLWRKAVGLRARAVERAVDEIRERVDLWIGDLDALPFDERRIHKLRRAIEYRRDRLARR
jgi:serine/threonine-protein kinase HipA